MNLDYLNDFLPVGSIVTIRFNNELKIMITGYTIIDSNKNKMYDYMGVIYPYGFDSYDNIIVFDRDVIKKVHFVGFETEECKELIKNAKKTKEDYVASKKQD